MVLFTLGFAFGVWLLQQQAALPDPARAWLLLGMPLLLLIPTRSLAFRVARAVLIASFASGLGFYHAAWQAEQRLAIILPDEWQGRDIEVIGVVAELPRSHEHGQRFSFAVEQVLTQQASVPKHVYLGTYFDKKTKPLALKAGERWRLTLRLKQPHGTSNPHGFDFEAWALENNFRAVGYVHNAEGLLIEQPAIRSSKQTALHSHSAKSPKDGDISRWLTLTKSLLMAGHPKGSNIRIDALADGLPYRIESWREAVREKFNATLDGAPYLGVLSALAIGDQSSIPPAQWQVFTRTGVNHLMSISGLHITMLASLGFAITYWMWRRSVRLVLLLPARKAAALAALLVALIYALLSGFAVPAQRTVYMVGAVAAALWLNRNFSLAQILCFALLGVMLADPWAVISPGFWLSFGAVALIMYVSAYRIGPRYRPMESATASGYAPIGRIHWQREGDDEGVGHPSAVSIPPNRRLVADCLPLAYPLRVLSEYANVQWAMTIGLIPLLLGLFQQVSLVSPIANAIAIPLVSLVVVPLALLGAVLPLDAPLWLAHSVMGWTMALLEWLNSLPQAVWTQHAPPAWSVVAGMLGVLWILLPRGFPARWLGFLLLLPMFLNTPELPAPGTLRLIIFDVGQGLAVAAQTRHHALLYDTGPDFSTEADSGNRILIPSLRAMGIAKLDGLILTHDDTDHTGGAVSVMQAMPIAWVSSSLPDEHPILQQAANKQRCMDGQRWQWDGVGFEMLHPDAASYASENIRDNNMGCVLRIGIGDQHVLLTADIEKESEQQLLKEHADKLPAAMLVVPHHGSKTSSTDAFIDDVRPNYAVFTVGYRNRFGHPKQEVVQRYMDSGAQLLRSDADGAILVEMNAQGLQVESYRKTHRRYWMQTGTTLR